jgi:hypothetical protein
MTAETQPRVALMWRGDLDERERRTSAPARRFAPIFEALAAEGVSPAPAVYCEEAADEVLRQLLEVDAVLVCVNPIQDGRDRTQLDAMLRQASARGLWVSSHPDVILKMGVKEVLYRTRDLGWGTDTHLYVTSEDFRSRFPTQLGAGPRVLKQNRGNGGDGVWKVQLGRGVASGDDALVEVLHAQRGSQIEHMSLSALMDRFEASFAGESPLVDQPFQARLPEGMIRCYLVQDRVVGFGRQLIKALMPPESGEPGPRIMSGADYPPCQLLRTMMENDWVPAMMRRLQIDRADLPVIWDADFLYGPKTAAGEDSYVLCEINVSAVMPIPDEAPAEIARCVARRLVHV